MTAAVSKHALHHQFTSLGARLIYTILLWNTENRF